MTESAVLPSPILVEEDDADSSDLITEQDLAHLTGLAGPEVHGWDSQVPKQPSPPTDNKQSGIDEPVSKAVLVPLLVAAAAVVLFAGYSIVSSSGTPRPDAVALVDRTTTTAMLDVTTTELTTPEYEDGAIGIELAEQASRLCAGEQFSIARAEPPSLAVFNDLVVATKDGRDDWTSAPDQQTLRSTVPPLVGCLTTVDGGEIDRCPTDGIIISRRSVEWTYRVLQTIDGTELGADAGTAAEVRPCDELILAAGTQDRAFWSELPQERFDLAAAAYTTAPHPSVACEAGTTGADPGQESLVVGQALTLDAAHLEASDAVIDLPESWQPTAERPVAAIACLTTVGADSPEPAADELEPDPAADPATATCPKTVTVTVTLRDGTPLGSWTHDSTTCPAEGELVAPPVEWWADTLGAALGYVEDEPSGE